MFWKDFRFFWATGVLLSVGLMGSSGLDGVFFHLPGKSIYSAKGSPMLWARLFGGPFDREGGSKRLLDTWEIDSSLSGRAALHVLPQHNPGFLIENPGGCSPTAPCHVCVCVCLFFLAANNSTSPADRGWAQICLGSNMDRTKPSLPE